MSRRICVGIDDLTQLMLRHLRVLGLTDRESGIVADVLLYAELRNTGQGIIKLLEKTVVPSPDRAPPVIRQCAPAIHHIDATGNAGMVALHDAAELTANTCKTQGLALTGVCGTATSTGSIGYYAEKIAARGYIGIVLAGSPKVMALHGGTQATLGTNPIAFAIPTSTEPLVFDMATAAMTWFDVIQAEKDDQPIPAGVAKDGAGHPTTDAAAALKGMLTTFGGVKGSGLALMFEILTGPMMQASIVGDAIDRRGNFLLAIDPRTLNENFVERTEQLLARMREGESDDFRLPGQYSATNARLFRKSGQVDVSESVYRVLQSEDPQRR